MLLGKFEEGFVNNHLIVHTMVHQFNVKIILKNFEIFE